VVSAAFSWAAPARAGGFDTFLGHSARHLGVGGAAVSYASGTAAVLHNPAGVGRIERAELLVAAGFLLPRIHAAPARRVNVDAQPMAAPFGLAGGALRLTEWLAAGFAVYPIAAAGASYQYPGALGETTDEMRAVMLEASPALGLTLPHGFSLGAGYRVTAMTMRRYARGARAAQPGIDVSMSGVDWRGLRLGAQWERKWGGARAKRRALMLGLSYRHTVRVPVDGGGGYALAAPIDHVQTTFVLPARAAAGIRTDYGRFSATLDVDYGLNSQNGRTALDVEFDDGRSASLPNVFGWQDSWGARGGLEYRALAGERLPIRVGYAFDGATATPAYPTAFGPPPTSTQMLTCGAGYVAERWRANAAYSYRFGSTQVTEGDVASSEPCAFCGYPGEYRVQVHGIYLDLSYAFGG